MTRSNAREILVHLVFELNFKNESADALLAALLDQSYYPSLQSETDIYAERPSERQLQYISDSLHGIERERGTLDGYIRKFAINWELSRISRVARAIMQVAMYECLHTDDVPVSAAINEAVELAKKYSSDSGPSFINGVLAKVAGREQRAHA